MQLCICATVKYAVVSMHIAFIVRKAVMKDIPKVFESLERVTPVKYRNVD